MKHIVINEEMLHQRADFAESRGLIPEFLFKLITASIKNPKELRLPFGGSVGQPGWDGIVISPHAFDPYVPEGQSFWEIGTGSQPNVKVEKDFEKRTTETSEAERKSSTFVFVTPRSGVHGWTIEQQSKWRDEKKQKTDWKDIQIIDATKLIQWLYLFPGIEFWLADKFGIPTKGISSPLVHWENLKRYGSPPDLSPNIFMINREGAVKKLLDIFNGKATELFLETLYPEEGVDFIAAVLASLENMEKNAFAGRCLIIDDPETWKTMCVLQEPHIFVATHSIDVLNTEAHLRNQARNKGHCVVFAGISIAGVHGNSEKLIEAKPYDLEEALISCGYLGERARMISNKCEGHLVIMKRLLLDISASPDWASSNIASELAIAALIGQWNGKFEGDREAITEILGKKYEEWLGKIRPMTLRPDPPIIQRDERWRFVSRFEGWQSLGSYLSNVDLDRFRKQASVTLREKDPKFTLPSEERWRSSIHNKHPKYSETLLKGFAETLALLGSHPRALTSCSPGKAISIATLTVRDILKNTDWVNWATLNDVTPLLAEAAPEEFLEIIEEILNDQRNKTFQDIFSQEGSGLMGGWNYITGILWALETLAWDQNYLSRVCLILGHLAEIDPGGKWANRPLESLKTILLPWHPQTCASLEIRKITVVTLLNECPRVGWKVLLTLLPDSHQVTSGSRKPSWRGFIPLDRSEKVSRKEYFEQITMYASLAVQEARADLKKLLELINKLDDLPPSVQSEILEYLSSDNVLNLTEKEKVSLWEDLLDLVIKHRKFADANWAMAKERIDKISEISDRLKPSTPELLHRRLFCQNEFELFQEKDNYEEQRQLLTELRSKAIEEILRASGIEGVVNFTGTVTDAQQVGLALGGISTGEYDYTILPKLLLHNQKYMERFAFGYVWSSFAKNGWSWVNKIDTNDWTDDQKSRFLAILPFDRETWKKAKELLGEKEILYWKQTDARPYELKEELNDAIEKLLQFNRPLAAIQCLRWMMHEKVKISTEYVSKALLASLTSDEPTYSVDQYEIAELIEWLQNNPEADEKTLSDIEWNYMRLLDHHFGHAPKTLERRLANDPSFFCEVIRTVFRSNKEENDPKQITEQDKQIATLVYELLFLWRTPPGTKHDGSFDSTLLENWFEEVKRSCEESGHLKAAFLQIGKVFAHAQPDPNGLWIHKSIAKILDEKEANDMRSAFNIERFNMRGMVTWTSGEQEKETAKDYREKATAVQKAGYIRFAASLNDLASSYEHDAEREASRDPLDS